MFFEALPCLIASYQADNLQIAKTPQPKSFSTVPFIKDAKFVDRESIMKDLASGFASNQRMALVGLAGAGYDDHVAMSKVVSNRA